MMLEAELVQNCKFWVEGVVLPIIGVPGNIGNYCGYNADKLFLFQAI